jgi:hypothetical protein
MVRREFVPKLIAPTHIQPFRAFLSSLRSGVIDDKDDSVNSPAKLSRKYVAQQLDISTATDKLAKLNAELSARDQYCLRLKTHLQELESRVQELLEVHEKDQKTIKKVERSKSFANREVAFLREQLVSGFYRSKGMQRKDLMRTLYVRKHTIRKKPFLWDLEIMISKSLFAYPI